LTTNTLLFVMQLLDLLWVFLIQPLKGGIWATLATNPEMHGTMLT